MSVLTTEVMSEYSGTRPLGRFIISLKTGSLCQSITYIKKLDNLNTIKQYIVIYLLYDGYEVQGFTVKEDHRRLT